MFPGIGFGEILIIMVLSVLLFGRNLPSVARTVGNSYQQFRKGLSDIQSNFRYDDIDSAQVDSSRQKKIPSYKDNIDAIETAASPALSAPRFDLPIEESVSHDSPAADPNSSSRLENCETTAASNEHAT